VQQNPEKGEKGEKPLEQPVWPGTFTEGQPFTTTQEIRLLRHYVKHIAQFVRLSYFPWRTDAQKS